MPCHRDHRWSVQAPVPIMFPLDSKRGLGQSPNELIGHWVIFSAEVSIETMSSVSVAYCNRPPIFAVEGDGNLCPQWAPAISRTNIPPSLSVHLSRRWPMACSRYTSHKGTFQHDLPYSSPHAFLRAVGVSGPLETKGCSPNEARHATSPLVASHMHR